MHIDSPISFVYRLSVPAQPNNTPIIQKPTPVVLDELLIEQTDSNKALYDREMEYGHLHPDRQRYPDYRFLKSEPTAYGTIRYFWGNDFTAQGAYNAAKTYSAEGNAYPIFTRSYRVLRSDYLANGPLDKLQPFTGLIAVKVTAGGSGYTKDFEVTFTGLGTSATALAIVDTASGTVIFIALTDVGVGYTAAPVVDLSAGDGTGATATAYIQPQTALLVKEEHSKLDDGDPYSSLYDRVTRTWETLPGPILNVDHVDETSGTVILGTKQLVPRGTVTSGLIGGTITELRINNGGSGGTAGTYNLGFSGGGGSLAAGTYTVTAASPAGKIGSIALTAGGQGYTSVPSAVIAGSGSGAAVSVSLVGTPIISLTLNSSDSDFTDAATLVITDSTGSGSGATGIATIAATGVGSIVVDSGGTDYVTPVVVITAPDIAGGTQATADATVSGGVITSISVTEAGTGYNRRPGVSITDSGGGMSASAHAELSMTSVESVTLQSTGNLYETPVVTVEQVGGGHSASVTAGIQPTSVASITLTSAGSGYSSPTLTFTGGNGNGATGTATVATGTITAVSLTNGGSGYTSPPTITTPSGGITGAVINAILGSITYREVEDLTTCKSLVTTNSIDLTTLPARKRFPVSFRVQYPTYQTAALVVVYGERDGNTNVDVGLNETTIVGGNGPALAWMDEYYMTDSQYASFQAGAFSRTGESTTYTLVYPVIISGSAKVWTFRTTPTTNGTTPGILDISASQKPFGIRKVIVIGIEDLLPKPVAAAT